MLLLSHTHTPTEREVLASYPWKYERIREETGEKRKRACVSAKKSLHFMAYMHRAFAAAASLSAVASAFVVPGSTTVGLGGSSRNEHQWRHSWVSKKSYGIRASKCSPRIHAKGHRVVTCVSVLSRSTYSRGWNNVHMIRTLPHIASAYRTYPHDIYSVLLYHMLSSSSERVLFFCGSFAELGEFRQ